ncbi:hypothetical protein [Ferroplasma sp. Type II]|nr:hypothetical protein [Ferroplasma sp. Type II]
MKKLVISVYYVSLGATSIAVSSYNIAVISLFFRLVRKSFDL